MNYDRLAPTYHRRYQASAMSATGAALVELVQAIGAQRVLEVGCGTGRWLEELRPHVSLAVGLDRSLGMLAQARERQVPALLVQADAGSLPLQSDVVDLVFSVNAFHHFADKRAYIAAAYRLLRPGGRLAILGSDPHGRERDWFVYRYFEGVYATDLQRFLPITEIAGMMQQQGFKRLEHRVVESIRSRFAGREVFSDPFLEKNSCSQLALLSQAEYQAGLERIRQDIERAEARGETLYFNTELTIEMISGVKAED